jgi:hypothetical protein
LYQDHHSDFVILTPLNFRRNSIDRILAHPTVNATFVVSDLKPLPINRFNEVQIVVPLAPHKNIFAFPQGSLRKIRPTQF